MYLNALSLHHCTSAGRVS